MEREEKYVQKIKNDVDERLYELLTLHLRDIDKKIRIHSEENIELKREFISVLERAIHNLREHVTSFNRLSYYRYIIILCNTILRFDTKRQDLKDMKKELVEDFTHSDSDEHGFIPLNYQMNEVRITYDVDYLTYLVQKYIDKGYWAQALYCLKAVDMLEPDLEGIDGWYRRINKNLKGLTPKQTDYETPIGKRLVIDSNIAISMISDDIGRYRFKERQDINRDIISSNTLFITPSVRDEVQKHIEFMNVKISKFCRNNPSFDKDGICSELHSRFEDLEKMYFVDVDMNEEGIVPVKAFYSQYVPTLAGIMDEKIGRLYVSHKLRKLAQREDLLPERGDMGLLSEVITLRDNGSSIDGLMSLDKDFTMFSGDIKERFGIDVFVPY